MQGYNGVDYVIIGIFFLSILAGLARGFVKEVISLLTWIAAFIVATTFASPVAASFSHSATVESVVSAAPTQMSWLALGGSFVGLFILTLICGSIINYFLSRIVEGTGISFANRLLGGLFGFARGFLINLLVIFLVQLVPQVEEQSYWTQSALVPVFQPTVNWLEGIIQPSIDSLKSSVGDSMNKLGSSLQGGMDNLKNLYNGPAKINP